MNDDTILNPKTCRCVKKDGKIGKQILKNDKNAKYCKKDKSYIKDKTDNCIEKDQIQKKGHNLSPKQQVNPKQQTSPKKSSKKENEPSNVKSVGPGIPKKFLPIVEDCSKNEKTWTKKWNAEVIDKSIFTIYQVCYLESDDCKYTIKKEFNIFPTKLKLDIEAFKELRSIGATPKIYAAWTCGNYKYFVMEKLKDYSDDIDHKMKRYRDYKKLLEKIKKKGWLYMISNPESIMLNSKNNPVLVNFGNSIKYQENGEIIGKTGGNTWKKSEKIQTYELINNNNLLITSIDKTKQLPSDYIVECLRDMYYYNIKLYNKDDRIKIY